MYKMSITPDFFDAFKKLPKEIQNQISDFFSEFPENPRKPGFNYEKLNGKVQGEILRSARINKECRVIIYEDVTNKTYYVLDIDHHDEAYESAERKAKIKNESNSITVESDAELLIKFKNFKKSLGLKPLLESVSAIELKNLGVPQKHISFVKSLTSTKNIEELEGLVPSETLLNLVLLAEGASVNELKSHDNQLKKQIMTLINEKVFHPALNCPYIEEDIKESVRNTYDRMIIKSNVDGIIDFFNDALISNRGRHIMETFHKYGLKAFEDIADDVKTIAAT